MKFSRTLSTIIIIVLACFVSAEDLDPQDQPEQTGLAEEKRVPIEKSIGSYQFTITPVASYRIAARVLGRERYWLGWEATLSPLDLALGWGEMSRTSVDDWISWNQSMRWYFYEWSAGSPYGEKEIREQSANVHIIPATEMVYEKVLDVEEGDTIYLEGYLVNVQGTRKQQRYHWSSSLTREDTGQGSCDLLYVERVVKQ